MGNKFVIDLLSFEKGKAYDFQEYIFNLLSHYFYQHEKNVLYGCVIIWCKEEENDSFVKFANKFKIEGSGCSSLLRLESKREVRYERDDVRCSSRNVARDAAWCGERRVAA